MDIILLQEWANLRTKELKGVIRGKGRGHAPNGHKKWLLRMVMLPNGHTLIDRNRFYCAAWNADAVLR